MPRVIDPFANGTVLGANQGGTGLSTKGVEAGLTLLTTGNSHEPFELVESLPGEGTVTSVAVATANGFEGTVADDTTTPIITLKTTVTGIIKGAANALIAAVEGTDYAPATTASTTQLLAGNGAGGFENLGVGSGLEITGGDLVATGGGGTVTSVSVEIANGFWGDVTNPTTAPALSIQTTVTGTLVGNGTAVHAGGIADIGIPVIIYTATNLTPASATPEVTGLSANVTNGETYAFEIFAYIGTPSGSGITLALNGGTATASAIVGAFTSYASGTTSGILHASAITELSSDLGESTATTVSFQANGTFTASSTGTFESTFATSTSATDTLLAGSWMRVTRIA